MARKKKVDMQEQIRQAMAFFGGRNADDEGYDLMTIFARGLATGMELERKKARAEQRKRENNG